MIEIYILRYFWRILYVCIKTLRKLLSIIKEKKLKECRKFVLDITII